ncbi:penicillin-binding transpeptidase domain-containing protein [Candidatus Latescibacterota bacterium]
MKRGRWSKKPMQTGPHVTRQQFVFLLLSVAWLIMGGKIAKIQVIDHHRLHIRAASQREQEVILRGSRGRILDRNGVELAINIDSASYGFRSSLVEDTGAAVRGLSQATGLSSSIIGAMAAADKSFQWLVRQADNNVSERLDTLNLPCIEKIPESRRYYRLGMIGAQLIGYTDIDGRGIDGCEYFLDDQLRGRDGRSVVFRDAKLRVMPSFDEPLIAPQNGCDIVLTIDWRIQEITEEELEAGVSKFGAESGGAIVVDTETGEILAMANVPRFDPNNFEANEGMWGESRKNRMATDMIEPGSIFKIVTFAEALESGVVSEGDSVFCENGAWRIGSHVIDDTHKLGNTTVRDVLVESSNIGTVKIAEKIGEANLYKRARLFGFGEVTGFDLPGETSGILENPRNWSKLSLPTISFGQGVAVSPLQIVMAYAVIANGGLLQSPWVIKEIRKSDGTVERRSGNRNIRRAVQVETAARMTELLCAVVESGTGRSAAVPDVRIAGKTGTAQRPKVGEKGYEPGKFISSFIGFIADRNPKILCFVMVDGPKGVHYGSQVAAPIFKKIINRMLNMGDNLWISPQIVTGSDAETRTVTLPSVKGMDVALAVRTLENRGFTVEVIGDSTTVVRQFPLAGAELLAGSSIALFSNVQTKVGENTVRVPDLKGKTMREAVQQLVQTNLQVAINGSGVVREQSPRAGAVVALGTVCTIGCAK